MASKGQSVGQEPAQGYADKKVSSFSGGMPYCSKNLESDTPLSRTELDFLHYPNANGSSSKPSTTSNLKESLNLQNSTKIKVATDGMGSTKQFVSKPVQSSSSSNFPCQSFGYVNKFQAPKHSYDKFPFRDAKDYHISTKIPSASYRPQDRKFNGCSETSTELVRGPRADRIHFPSSAEKNELSPLIRRDQFNKSDFETKYTHAKFFMIKSYSEEDIHKSIKYNVWASTPNGNNKLEAAFKEAQATVNENVPMCPVFLFFSVNASGQFVGLAEMIGPVDFNKSMEFWHKDKWNGFFPVKWHMIKDIPNKYFQNIRLENNDNKPVTFSRDTQEIGLPQGLKMLQFFKGYPLARSLLDDYDFYEKREKFLNDQRTTQQQFSQTMYSEDWEAEFGQMSISGNQWPSYGDAF
ncbi:YTH domain-containing family protein 3-like [Phalaenopsis equestris]|uniref:YTH domain-containing family protein 3-like n=1 Tax=Phalaenopsis equestris TaxID=78828 RepID=UPI0009E25081|nr:YTH domain-containing family protein 3-like [Phalaenopsis equestris]XP_020590817.1 YTH domain-containing family protein 3-like [Phalaenopsis equestris]